MKTLIIAEKPSVAADVAEALGGGFTRTTFKKSSFHERDDLIISNAIGHLCELKCPEDQDPGFNLDRLPAIPDQFMLAPIEKTSSQLELLRHLIHRPDIEAVVNACDAGREGELIFRYIAIYLGCRKPVYRMWLQSMTHAAIIDAFAGMEPSNEYDNLFFAAQCRSESDWLVGINGTRGVSKLAEQQSGQRSKSTVGRVQTPVVALLVDRENEIKTFVTKIFHEVVVKIGDRQTNQHYTGTWTNPEFRSDPNQPDDKATRLFEKQHAEAIYAKCKGHPPTAVRDENTDVQSLPPKLFDLTALQREANKRLGYTAAATLKLAQSLYEKHKVLTYPRTDASALPEDYVANVKNTLTRIIQSGHQLASCAEIALHNVKPDKRIFNNKKISDHFAIIPTGKISADLTPDERQLYDLVLRRFIAIFHPTAQYYRTVRTTLINGEAFVSRGQVLVSPGWLQVYAGQNMQDEDEAPDEENQKLSPIQQGQQHVADLRITDGKTRKPPRYTEAMLLSAMETAGAIIDDEDLRDAMKGKGLGTPATRAPTIEHLVDPKVAYAERQKKLIIPTAKASDLIKFLRANGLDFLTSAKTTGEWEHALLQMEAGRYTRQQFMGGIYQMVNTMIGHIKTIAAQHQATQPAPQKLDAPCPQCGGELTHDRNTLSCACGFKLWKTIAGLSLNDAQLITLLTTRSLPPIQGFISAKTKKPFKAGLRLAEGGERVEFVFA